MSFLSRRRNSRPFAATNSANTPSSTPFPSFDPSSESSDDNHSQEKSSFRRRLSSLTLLTSIRPNLPSQPQKPQKHSTLQGIGFIADHHHPDSYYSSRSRSPSPTPSLTIRRPSGLGRRASQCSNASKSFPHSPRAMRHPPRRRPIPHMGRFFTQSSTDLYSQHEELARWVEVTQWEEEEATLEGDDDQDRPPFDISRISPELLKDIFSHCSRHDLTSLASVCSSFLAPARTALYGDLDFTETKDFVTVERCVSLLASRKDLAILVKSFASREVPTIKSGDGSASLQTVTFAIAFTNMTQLQSLVLPRFAAHLLFHTSFRLRKFTLLCDHLSEDETRDLLAWLVGQPTVTHLLLPNLAMKAFAFYNDTGSSAGRSSPSSSQEELPNNLPSPSAYHIPPHLLPRLSHFHGPASLASALVSGRPLQSVSLHIHSTLYDGLRPSALMSALARSTSKIKFLGLEASSKMKVDARTLERVLMSAGAELGDYLEVLEVDWVLEDEILYKQILSALPRFHKLHTIRLNRRVPPPPPRSPPPSLPLPSTGSSPSTSSSILIVNSPAASSSSLTAATNRNSKSFAVNYITPPASPLPPTPITPTSPTPSSTTSSTTRARSSSSHSNPKKSSSAKRISTSTDIPLSRVHERSHLASWSAKCGSLRKVVFLSGAEWCVGMGLGGSGNSVYGDELGTMLFTFVGYGRR